MTKRIKLIAIVLSVVIMVALVGSIGATAAIWTSGSSGGNSEVGPSATSENWNVWAKYFTCSGGVLTGFHFAIEDPTNSDSFNHNRLIIPNSVGGIVTTISGGLFEASVMKEMAEELAIPSSIEKIRASAFSGFSNLKTVTFQLKPASSTYTIDEFVFAGASKLTKVFVGDVELSSLTFTEGEDGYLTYIGTDADLPNTTLKISKLAFFGSNYELTSQTVTP